MAKAPARILKKVERLQGKRLDRCAWGKVVAKARQPGVSLEENEGYSVLRGQELAAVVSKATGLVVSITSLLPRAFDILPPRENGLMPYFWDRDSGHFEIANRPVGAQGFRGRFEGRPYLGIKSDLRFGRRLGDRAQLAASYRMFADRFQVEFRVEYLKDDDAQFEAGVSQAYQPKQWRRHLYVDVNRTTRAWQMEERGYERYYDALWDTTTARRGPDEPLYRARYPYGILERADRFLVWGILDLNCFAILSPNRLGGIPSFCISPKGIKAGEGYTFNFTYKVLPRPPHELADACRWYAENCYSTNRLTRGIVTLPRDLKPRTIATGNVMSGFYPPCWPNREREKARVRQNAKKMGAVHLWYGPWFPWTEDHPTKGRWYIEGDFWQTAEGVKAEIKQLQRQGFHVYLYVRQLRQTAAFYDDRPPYRDWLYLTREGFPWNFTFTGLPSPDIRERIPEAVKKAYGEAVQGEWTTCAYIDLCNDDARKWLTREIKNALDYYQPAGVAWDMGWGDVQSAPCIRHPGDGLHHASVRIQYDIWKWVQKKHPRMRMVLNESKGSPSQLYAHAMMFEAGDHIDEIAAESVKCYRTALTALYYREIFPDAEWPQAIMRHLSYGVTMSGRWGGEELEGSPFEPLTALAAFSAKCNNTPLVIESGAFRLSPKRAGLSGAVWADRQRLLVAVWNGAASAAQIDAQVAEEVVRKYGWRGGGKARFTVLSSAGLPRPDASFRAKAGAGPVEFRGRLAGHEMVLAEWETDGPGR